jgi:hypothetical protein
MEARTAIFRITLMGHATSAAMTLAFTTFRQAAGMER